MLRFWRAGQRAPAPGGECASSHGVQAKVAGLCLQTGGVCKFVPNCYRFVNKSLLVGRGAKRAQSERADCD